MSQTQVLPNEQRLRDIAAASSRECVQETLKQRAAWRKAQTARLMGQSRQSLWRAEREGRFPRAKQYGNSKMYDTRDLLAWIDNPNQDWSK